MLANGAGLAMATMDIIKLKGGEPANFLDVGGTASHEQIMEAVKLLENDERIGSIIFNIFGGIMSCERIAASILKAAEEIKVSKPIVLRLKGNNSASAKEMIESKGSNLGLYFCDQMDIAAELAVKLAKEYTEKREMAEADAKVK